LELLDQEFNLIVENDDAGDFTQDSAIVWELGAGDYYARVREFNDEFGAFQIRVGAGVLPDPIAPDSVEAITLGIGADVEGQFQDGGTVYSLQLDTAGSIEITTESDLGTVLELLNADFRTLTQNDDDGEAQPAADSRSRGRRLFRSRERVQK
jgi:hypothetical protein